MKTTITPLVTYRNERPYPFCPGCGHATILDRLNEALQSLSLDPEKVVLVSDIGCSGLSDQYFSTSAFHGLHGRSVTYASGIKMARLDLTVIVIMGDGGTGIGGTHLLSAARRNIGVTVLVLNNFNFGMTGGQHSTTTPRGAITSTTRAGNLERPMDICATVAANGASYVVRATSFDEDLTERIADGIRSGGFSLLDIWELCTAYYVPSNKLSRRSLDELVEELDFARGVLASRELPEYSLAYRDAHKDHRNAPLLSATSIPVSFQNAVERRFELVVAGSAGGKIRSASRLVAKAAVASGLWVTQRDDYPITVMTGHSIAELVLDRSPIEYHAVSRPDALILLSDDGLKKSGAYLAAMTKEQWVFAEASLPPLQTAARVLLFDFGAMGIRCTRASQALAMLYAVARKLQLVSPQALQAQAGGAHSDTNTRALTAGEKIAEFWEAEIESV